MWRDDAYLEVLELHLHLEVVLLLLERHVPLVQLLRLRLELLCSHKTRRDATRLINVIMYSTVGAHVNSEQ